MKKYTNVEFELCRLSSEDIMAISSEIAALEGNLAADASAPGIGGDSISIGFDG